ncbi:MAG: OB-fold domain-containing protein, partial [bacterium]|nr:OB-fold domain-containing protein [bacterium]
MIGYLKGRVIKFDPVQVLLDVNGVGFAPMISFSSQVSLGELVGNVILRGVSNNYLKYDGISAQTGRL